MGCLPSAELSGVVCIVLVVMGEYLQRSVVKKTIQFEEGEYGRYFVCPQRVKKGSGVFSLKDPDARRDFHLKFEAASFLGLFSAEEQPIQIGLESRQAAQVFGLI
jgi:hypothetical protein